MPGPQLRSRTGPDPEYRVLPRFGDETAIARHELCQALMAADVRAERCDAAAVASLEPRTNPAVPTRGMDSGHRYRQRWSPGRRPGQGGRAGGSLDLPELAGAQDLAARLTGHWDDQRQRRPRRTSQV